MLAGLALLNRVLARRLLQFRRAAQAEERARLAASAAHERQVFEGALQQLANTLRPELKPVQARESSLLAAASIVGDAIGIVIKAPAASEDLARLKDPIEAIARASRVRHRTVILAGRWWEEDCGPLIAYRGAAQAPVGFVGKLSMITRVFGVIAAATASGLSENPCSLVVTTGTGTAWAITMLGLYET